MISIYEMRKCIQCTSLSAAESEIFRTINTYWNGKAADAAETVPFLSDGFQLVEANYDHELRTKALETGTSIEKSTLYKSPFLNLLLVACKLEITICQDYSCTQAANSEYDKPGTT
jgi:hypothetical protein